MCADIVENDAIALGGEVDAVTVLIGLGQIAVGALEGLLDLGNRANAVEGDGARLSLRGGNFGKGCGKNLIFCPSVSLC